MDFERRLEKLEQWRERHVRHAETGAENSWPAIKAVFPKRSGEQLAEDIRDSFLKLVRSIKEWRGIVDDHRAYITKSVTDPVDQAPFALTEVGEALQQYRLRRVPILSDEDVKTVTE